MAMVAALVAASRVGKSASRYCSGVSACGSPAIAALNPVKHDGHMGRGLGDRPVGARRGALDVIGLPQQRGEPLSRRADRRPGRFPVQCHYCERAGLAGPLERLVWMVMVVSSGRYESTIRCRRREIVGPNA